MAHCNLTHTLRSAHVRSTDAVHRFFIGGLLLAAVLCPALTPRSIAQDKTAANAPQPLAILDGQPISEDQFSPEAQAQLHRMMQQIYMVKLRALNDVLGKKLLDADARQKGVSVADLVRSEIAKVPDPTDEQVKAYFDEHQINLGRPFDEVKGQIRQTVKTLAVQNVGTTYNQGLVQRAINEGQLSILLSPPRIEVKPDPARLKGSTDAPITIVEFSDFSCTYCQRAESTITALLARYPGKIKLSYRDFPLAGLHPSAEIAAEASRCAAEQSRFWEYHDLLFAHQGQQSHDDLLGYARDLKLDDKQFASCLDSGRHKDDVQRDVQLGARGGVIATPSFFVNGTFIDGAQPATTFEKIINHELAAPAPAHATQETAGLKK